MKRIVCDTGPLVHLFEANLLDLLAAAGMSAFLPASPMSSEVWRQS